jgi:hypothetical protein
MREIITSIETTIDCDDFTVINIHTTRQRVVLKVEETIRCCEHFELVWPEYCARFVGAKVRKIIGLVNGDEYQSDDASEDNLTSVVTFTIKTSVGNMIFTASRRASSSRDYGYCHEFFAEFNGKKEQLYV